jgi:hypothetical protein
MGERAEPAPLRERDPLKAVSKRRVKRALKPIVRREPRAQIREVCVDEVEDRPVLI